MEDNDREEWLACAAADSVLLAHELLWLSRPSERVPWRSLLRRSPPLGDEEAPSASGIGSPAFRMLEPLAWANRAPRSKKARRIGATAAKAEEEDEEAAKRGRARGSPTTPLRFPSGSGASASGAEEGSISAGDAEAATAADAMCSRPPPSERGIQAVAPVVARIPETRPIRRPGKRKNVSELRAMEKLLLEERTLLQKELESRGRKREELKEENERLKRLKLSLQSKSESKERENDEDQMQGGFLLPDLNEPAL